MPAHIIPSDGGGQHVMLQHDVAGKPPLFHASTDQARKLEHVGSPVPRTHLPARISTTTCRPSSRSRRTDSMLASISRRSDAQRMAEDLTTCKSEPPCARAHLPTTYTLQMYCRVCQYLYMFSHEFTGSDRLLMQEPRNSQHRIKHENALR